MAEGGKKSSRKVGRNRAHCLAYRTNQIREFNKSRRLIKYLKRNPRDVQAFNSLQFLGKVLYSAQKSALKYTEFTKAWEASH
jgi:hypothetical protein